MTLIEESTPAGSRGRANAPAPPVGLLVAEVTAVQTVAGAAMLAMPAMAPLVAASLGLETLGTIPAIAAGSLAGI